MSTSNKPLYRLPAGRWSFMDLQGEWWGRLLRMPGLDACLEVDGHPEVSDEWRCQEFAVVASESPEPQSVWAAWSMPPPSLPFDDSLPKALSAEGLGWALAEDCRVWLNGNPRPWRAPRRAGPVPMPFWEGFRSDKPLPWIQVPLKLESLFDSRNLAAETPCLVYEKASSPETLTALDSSGRQVEDSFRSILGRASCEVRLTEGVNWLVMRRTYDAFHGMQRARILINGRMAGWWHQPEEDRDARWAQDDMVLPLSPELQGQKIVISLEPPAGAPLFSLSRLEAWATIAQR